MIRFNYFLAVLPDAATSKRIVEVGERLRGKHRLPAHLRPARIFHVSLHGLPSINGLPQEITRAVSNTCEAVAATTPSFEVVLNQTLSFRYSDALVLMGDKKRNAGLVTLHRALASQLRRNGLRVSLNFTPHLTLLYGEHHIKEPIEPVNWHAGEFVLVRSHVRFTHYDLLKRWKLRGGQNPSPIESSPAPHEVQTEFQWE